MKLWANEREVPSELLELLNSPDLPSELRREIINAQNEVTNYGAVSYPTKARVEYYTNKYQDILTNLLNQNLEDNEKAN